MGKWTAANWRNWPDVIPYTDFLYFGMLLYVAVAALILGLLGRFSWRWVLLINVAMIVVQYSQWYGGVPPDAIGTVAIVAGFGVFQWTVASLFLRIRSQRDSRAAFRAAFVLALLPLAIVKFLPFAALNTYIGFLGISYVTFRSLDVIFCIHDRLIKTLSPGAYAAFLLFFPAVSSGPIDRYNRFVADYGRRRSRSEFLQDLDGAVHRIVRGLFYKFVLAVLVKTYWLDPMSSGSSVTAIAGYMYAYAFYLFFDFAGYSAFAIGVGYLFGIHTPENFKRPFLARNIVDFWNRWHISLSIWFRDHVYMRFIMTAMRRRWFSNRLLISCMGFYVSFGLMAVWHGVAVRYLVYGLYHATLMAGYTVYAERKRGQATPTHSIGWTVASTAITFNLVCFGLLIFSGRLG
jgi:membrane protein involved in D-alanine export